MGVTGAKADMDWGDLGYNRQEVPVGVALAEAKIGTSKEVLEHSVPCIP